METNLARFKTSSRQTDAVIDNHSAKPCENLSLKEDLARKQATHSIIYLVLVNLYSAMVVFVVHLISVESLISIGLSVGLTIHVHNITDETTDFDGSTMSWVLLSFAVITPISGAISMAFSRREQALVNIAQLRSAMMQLYISHASWDWEFKEAGSGRERSKLNLLGHADKVHSELVGIAHDLTRYLTMPNVSRARHRLTPTGIRENKAVKEVQSSLYSNSLKRFMMLSECCEILKKDGLPGNEASRMRQWERQMQEYIERLNMIKRYRTPQALRSFSRLFSIFLPPFYAPFYAQLAHDINSLGLAVAFSVLTSIALTSLFETISQMEDPFVVNAVLDGINVNEELIHDFCTNMDLLRSHYFPQASKMKVQSEERTIDGMNRVMSLRILTDE